MRILRYQKNENPPQFMKITMINHKKMLTEKFMLRKKREEAKKTR